MSERDEFYHGSALVLDSVVVSALARKDRGPGSSLGMGGSPGDVSENPVTQEKQQKGWRMSCDVGKAREGLENEL